MGEPLGLSEVHTASHSAALQQKLAGLQRTRPSKIFLQGAVCPCFWAADSGGLSWLCGLARCSSYTQLAHAPLRWMVPSVDLFCRFAAAWLDGRLFNAKLSSDRARRWFYSACHCRPCSGSGIQNFGRCEASSILTWQLLSECHESWKQR